MKVDPVAAHIIGTSILLASGLGLFCMRKRLLQVFALFLLGFLLLEILISSVGFGKALWWAIHLPSAIVLGADETLERHGVIPSTVFHLADLVLWSALLSIPMAIRLTTLKKKETDATASRPLDPGHGRSAPDP
jgi:hypothetical protein